MDLAAELHETQSDALEEMLEALEEEGSGHDDEGIDSMAEAIITAAIDEK